MSINKESIKYVENRMIPLEVKLLQPNKIIKGCRVYINNEYSMLDISAQGIYKYLTTLNVQYLKNYLVITTIFALSLLKEEIGLKNE